MSAFQTYVSVAKCHHAEGPVVASPNEWHYGFAVLQVRVRAMIRSQRSRCLGHEI